MEKILEGYEQQFYSQENLTLEFTASQGSIHLEYNKLKYKMEKSYIRIYCITGKYTFGIQ